MWGDMSKIFVYKRNKLV